MAKFTWTVESDDPKEAVRINEEMAAMMYRIHKGAKAPVREPGRKVQDAEFEVVNPSTEERRPMPRNAKGIREAADQLVAWIAVAKTLGDLAQLIGENQEMIRTLFNKAQKTRLTAKVADRELVLAADERRRGAPPVAPVTNAPKPTREAMTELFRNLFDLGGEGEVKKVLAAFKVETVKDLPEDLWGDVATSVQSAIVALSVGRATP